MFRTLAFLYHSSIYYLFVIFIQIVYSDPVCIYDIGNGLQIDLRTLGFPNGKGPKYDRISMINPTRKTFSWNGCFPYSKSSDHGNCTNAAACYTDSISNISIRLATQDSFRFEYTHGSSILSYQSSNTYLTVFLICRDDNDDTATSYQYDKNTYSLHIQSRCCCPGMCSYSNHTISPTIILIIIIIIFLLVYIFGSIIFLRYNDRMTNANHYSCFNFSLCRRNQNIGTDYHNI